MLLAKKYLPPNLYDGEVFLSPPREKPYGLEASFGVIQININSEIRGITTVHAMDVIEFFGNSKRDTLCKQMGYTEAVTDSVYTISAFPDFHFDTANQ